jgi:hypothetical protein
MGRRCATKCGTPLLTDGGISGGRASLLGLHISWFLSGKGFWV